MSPIRSLQVENLNIREGLVEIGKLHKGAPKPQQGNRPGADLSHFRFVPQPEFEYTLAIWNELYGEKPEWFDPVFVIGEAVEDAFNPWMEEWSATALIHRCDEESQVLHYEKAIEMYSRARIPCERVCGRACGCKPVGRLNLLLPEFMVAVGVTGYITAETHSVNDILLVQKALGAAVAMTGRVTGVAFIFGRAPEKITARIIQDGKAKRVNTTKSLFFLRPNAEYTRDFILPELAAAGKRPMFGNEAPASTPLLNDGQTAIERMEGNKPASRRIGAPVVKYEPPVEEVEGELVDEGEGELVDEGEGEKKPTPWTEKEAKAWVKSRNAEGFNDTRILQALAIAKLGDFAGGVPEANTTFNGWLNAQLDGGNQTEAS